MVVPGSLTLGMMYKYPIKVRMNCVNEEFYGKDYLKGSRGSLKVIKSPLFCFFADLRPYKGFKVAKISF